MTTEVALQDRHAGEFVPATLIDRIDLAYAQRVDDRWLTFVAAEKAKAGANWDAVPRPEHDHWRWGDKVAEVHRLLSYLTLAIECEADPQGLMMLQTDGQFAQCDGNRGKPLVYAVFLATAPWNLGAIVARPRFRGVGSVLLRAAVQLSLDLGFKGRIGLHSLPQAEAYYARIGMIDLGPDPAKQNLNYFEMTPAKATAFIS